MEDLVGGSQPGRTNGVDDVGAIASHRQRGTGTLAEDVIAFAVEGENAGVVGGDEDGALQVHGVEGGDGEGQGTAGESGNFEKK